MRRFLLVLALVVGGCTPQVPQHALHFGVSPNKQSTGLFGVVQQSAQAGYTYVVTHKFATTPQVPDILLETIAYSGTNDPTPPDSTWYLLPTAGGTTNPLHCPTISIATYFRYVSASEPASYTFTFPGLVSESADMREIAQTFPTPIVDQNAMVCLNTPGASLQTPIITPAVAGEWGVSMFAIDPGTNPVSTLPQSGWAEDYVGNNPHASEEGQHFNTLTGTGVISNTVSGFAGSFVGAAEIVLFPPQVPPQHVMLATDTGQYFAGSLASGFNGSWYNNHITFARDQKIFTTDTGALYCPGETALGGTITPAMWHALRAGVTCLSMTYANIGNNDQDYVNDDLSACTSTPATSQPYDTWWLSETQNQPTNLNILAAYGINSPLLYSAHIGSYTPSAWLLKAGHNGGPCAQPSGHYAQTIDNPGSPILVAQGNTYLQGQSGTGTANGVANVAYGWANPGSNPCVDHNQPCSEPATHKDVYAIVDADNQRDTSTCPNPGFGGTLQLDPSLTSLTNYWYEPGYVAAQVSAWGQFKHRDNTPYIGIGNGGDCGASNLPSFDYDLTTSPHQQRPIWPTTIANLIGINSENFAFDSSTCNNFPTEPTRRGSNAIFAINSATLFYAVGKVWEWQGTCYQSTAFLGQANFGGALDLGLRYWNWGLWGLAFDDNWAFVRFNYYGADGNAKDITKSDIFPEGSDFIPWGPVSVLPTYTPGASPTGGLNGATGTDGQRALHPGPGESGGILSLCVPNTVGTLTQASAFFQQGCIAERQYKHCYYHQVDYGPCADVTNLRMSSGGTGGLDYTATLAAIFANDGGPLVTYAHLWTIGDGSPDATEADIKTGGALSNTQTTISVVRSKATSQTPTCTEGFVTAGSITVCELSSVWVTL